MRPRLALALPDDAVDLWFASPSRLAVDASARAWAQALLQTAELANARQPRAEEHRVQALFARALLRATLSRYAEVAPQDWRFETGPHGRPELARLHDGSDAPAFNLSHAAGLVAIAAARGVVGVDIEAAGRTVAPCVAQRFFAPDEREQLEALPASQRDRRFIELWTLKESYAKARGLGLRLPFDSFGFDLRHAGRLGFSPEPASVGSWHFQLLETTLDEVTAVCAICTARPARVIAARALGSDLREVDLPVRTLSSGTTSRA